MDINLGELLHGNILAIEFEVQQQFQHQIMVEASAAKSEKQRHELEFLYDKARAIVDVDGPNLIIDLTFLSIPDNLKDYAELIKSNARSVTVPNIKELVMGYMSVGEARDQLYDYFKEYAIEHIQEALGGVS